MNTWHWCFSQKSSTPRKRKQSTTGMDANNILKPTKKLHTELPASPVKDSPRKSSLRLNPQTQIQTSSIRMSPRKLGQPPSTPTKASMRAETPRRASKVPQAKAGEAHSTQKDSVDKNGCSAAKLQSEADATVWTCKKTQVMCIQVFKAVLILASLKVFELTRHLMKAVHWWSVV